MQVWSRTQDAVCRVRATSGPLGKAQRYAHVSWNAGLSIYAVTTNIRSVSARHAFLSQVLPANLQQHVAEFCRVATLPEPWKVLWENVGVHDSLEESSSEDDDPD